MHSTQYEKTNLYIITFTSHSLNMVANDSIWEVVSNPAHWCGYKLTMVSVMECYIKHNESTVTPLQCQNSIASRRVALTFFSINPYRHL